MVKANFIFSAELKVKVVLELIKNERNIIEIAEEFNVQQQLMLKWKESFLEMTALVLDQSNKQDTEKKLKMLLKQNDYDCSEEIYWNEALLSCIRTLSEIENLKPAMEKLLEVVCKYHNADRGYIFECNDYDKLISNTYEWCREGVTAEIDELQNLPIKAVEKWITNFEETGSMAAPFMKDGVIRGFIGFDNPKEEIDNYSLLSVVTYFVINNIQKRRMNSELEVFSYVDALTQLYNRNKYTKDLEQMEKQHPQTLGVVYIDLNGLKVANNKYGYSYGDYLLKQMANVLKHIFGNNVYRIGGDEFVVLSSDITKDIFDENVLKLRNAVSEGKELSASIGMTWEDKNFRIKDIIKHADDLMYANKQHYYEKIHVMDYNHNSSLAKQLIKDLAKGRYIVHLQPKISLDNGELSGAEALIRGIDKEGNLVFPDCFIPVYESHGIIRHIDFFVLESVCQLINHLKKEDREIGNISVNFSRTTLLEYEVVNRMLDICEENRVNPASITIEITETAAKLQRDELITLVDEIKQAGFSVSLDDYGSEYSNMSILTNIGFDEIKLDKSIVNELTINEKTRTITQYTVKMLKELKMDRVVAEGIETIEELSIVKQYGCDYGQGYHFSRPISVEQFIHKYFEIA